MPDRRPTQQDVLLALLALDSYSRGANAQLLNLGKSYGDSALNSDGGFGAQSRDGTIECTVTEIWSIRRCWRR